MGVGISHVVSDSTSLTTGDDPSSRYACSLLEDSPGSSTSSACDREIFSPCDGDVFGSTLSQSVSLSQFNSSAVVEEFDTSPPTDFLLEEASMASSADSAVASDGGHSVVSTVLESSAFSGEVVHEGAEIECDLSVDTPMEEKSTSEGRSTLVFSSPVTVWARYLGSDRSTVEKATPLGSEISALSISTSALFLAGFCKPSDATDSVLAISPAIRGAFLTVLVAQLSFSACVCLEPSFGVHLPLSDANVAVLLSAATPMLIIEALNGCESELYVFKLPIPRRDDRREREAAAFMLGGLEAPDSSALQGVADWTSTSGLCEGDDKGHMSLAAAVQEKQTKTRKLSFAFGQNLLNFLNCQRDTESCAKKNHEKVFVVSLGSFLNCSWNKKGS